MCVLLLFFLKDLFIRTQFCVHSDKQELIRNLTESIHDGVPFISVLLQLSKSISDGK